MLFVHFGFYFLLIDLSHNYYISTLIIVLENAPNHNVSNYIHENLVNRENGAKGHSLMD